MGFVHVRFQREAIHKLLGANSAKEWVHNTIRVFILPVPVNSMFICPDFGMVGTVWVSTFKPGNTIRQTYFNINIEFGTDNTGNKAQNLCHSPLLGFGVCLSVPIGSSSTHLVLLSPTSFFSAVSSKIVMTMSSILSACRSFLHPHFVKCRHIVWKVVYVFLHPGQ